MQGFRFELLENIKSWSDVLLYIKFQIPNFCRKEEFGHSQKTPLSWGQVEAASLDVNLYTSFCQIDWKYPKGESYPLSCHFLCCFAICLAEEVM